MGHSPRRIQFQLFKTFTLKMKTFIFLVTAVVLTTYSSPVPNPKPQIYNNKIFDYSQDCYDSQCQQNNQIGGYKNYDYDYYGGGRGQGGKRRRFQGGNRRRFQGGNGGSRLGGNGGGRGSNGSQNCVDSQCHQNYPKGGIGGGVAGGNKQNCVGSQCQQNFDGKDHSNFFTDSFWNRRRNGK